MENKEKKLRNLVGAIRKIDCLGRIVIPSEFRKIFDLHQDDLVDLVLDLNNKEIIIKKNEGIKIAID